MINIASRLRPFSHLPGAQCMIPTTEYVVEAFPALIRIKNLDNTLVKEITIDVKGPVKQFTLMQDLERGCVTLFCESYRFHILPNLELSFQKNPPLPPLANQERLSLGSHKKQEWEQIKKRCSFTDIFPLWFRLGSLLQPQKPRKENRGMFSLLNACQKACEAHRPEHLLAAFEKLLLCGFTSLLVPRVRDLDHQGILPPQEPLLTDSPLHLLTEGAALIRALFLLASDNEIAILPNLPPEFFAGRFLHVACPPYGVVDLEWSKKIIRQLLFHATQDGEVIFHFHSSISHYRVRVNGAEKGRRVAAGDSLEIKSGSFYLLDLFQK